MSALLRPSSAAGRQQSQQPKFVHTRAADKPTKRLDPSPLHVWTGPISNSYKCTHAAETWKAQLLGTVNLASNHALSGCGIQKTCSLRHSELCSLSIGPLGCTLLNQLLYKEKRCTPHPRAAANPPARVLASSDGNSSCGRPYLQCGKPIDMFPSRFQPASSRSLITCMDSTAAARRSC